MGPGWRRDERGQVAVLSALLMTVVLIVGGFAVDYGVVYLEAARFRHAVDAAALAGASERQLNAAGGTAAAEAVVMSYLARHGYAPDAETAVTVSFPDATSVQVDTERSQRTYFLRSAGIDSVAFGHQTVATIGGNKLDVVLAIDITYSMFDQVAELRQAAAAFIDQLDPGPDQPNGPQVAVVVYQGMRTPNRSLPAGNRNVKVATHLTNDQGLLKKILDGSGASACPTSWPVSQPAFSNPSFPFGFPFNTPAWAICPLKALGMNTYVGNGFDMALRPDQGWDIWSAANGGRTDAKKVLVLITDGTNNIPPLAVPDLNTDTLAAAATVKLGPDQDSGTADDVEIFTIGLYDPAVDPSSFVTDPPLCPAPVVPASPAPTSNDLLLIGSSSSSAGSCDHYYPLHKDKVADLPEIFTTIATRILRARLSQ